LWSSGKWRPYNEDGTEHDCKSKKSGKEKKQVTLEMVQRKLDSIGIIINVEVDERMTKTELGVRPDERCNLFGCTGIMKFKSIEYH
jgi:hypothetical protein